MFVGGVRLGVWVVVLVGCVCRSVSVSGVLFSVGVCVCVCDLLICLRIPHIGDLTTLASAWERLTSRTIRV